MTTTRSARNAASEIEWVTSSVVAEVAAKSRATIPVGRYGKPEEFADVVTFLASARAGYVTGSRIRIDGGSIKGV